MPARKRTASPRRQSKADRPHQNGPVIPQRIHAEVERISAPTTSSGITSKVRMALDTVRRHPFICASVGLVGGFALGTAGALMVTAGAAIALSGAGLAATAQSTGLVILVLGMFARSQQAVGAALGVMLVGTLAGAVIGILGTLVTALGAACSILGTLSLVLSSLLAAGRLSHLAYQHREDIRLIVERIRAKIRPRQPALASANTLSTPAVTDMSMAISETR